MGERKFSIGEAIGFGWETMKGNMGFFIVLLLVLGAINIGPCIITNMFKAAAKLNEGSETGSAGFTWGMLLLAILVSLGGSVLHVITSMGIIRITLKMCDGEKALFSDLFSCLHLFFKFLGASLLCALIVVPAVGVPVVIWIIAAAVTGVSVKLISAVASLLVIPGIYLAIRLWIVGYCVVDKGLGPVQSLIKSFALTRGSAGALFLFALSLGFINLVGALCLLVGLFATIPTSYVAMAFVYRKLREADEDSGAVISPGHEWGSGVSPA